MATQEDIRHVVPQAPDNDEGRTSRDSAWLAACTARVQARLDYPDAARRQGREGKVLVRVVLNADGSLISAALITRSGQPDLDRAALAAVHRAAPFMAPPSDWDRPARVDLPVRFQLESLVS